MHHDPGLVTGDAVVLDLPLARSASRALALGIDVLVQLACLFLFLVALTSMPLNSTLLLTLLTTGQLVVIIAYFTMLEGFSRGRTVGKMALGLRVVRQDGGPIQFRHAFVRALASVFVDFGPLGVWGVVGFLVSLVSREGKRIGDFLAGTVVIRQRAPKSPAPEIAMPPELASWAAQLDLTALPHVLALSVRQYLGRYRQLGADHRERVGRQLAAEVARYVGAAAPPHTPARIYLAAVLAERQSRDYARMAGPGHPGSQPSQTSGTQRGVPPAPGTHAPPPGVRSTQPPNTWSPTSPTQPGSAEPSETDDDSFTPPA